MTHISDEQGGSTLGKPDPLATALAAAKPSGTTHPFKVLQLFGDRPEVLAAIIDADARKVSHAEIARLLSSEGESISDSAIRTWLKAKREGRI